MSYNYINHRDYVFSEQGQPQFLRIRDRIAMLLKLSGAVRMEEALAKESGLSWEMLACVDRLVELKELRELTDSSVPAQYRVFVREGQS